MTLEIYPKISPNLVPRNLSKRDGLVFAYTCFDDCFLFPTTCCKQNDEVLFLFDSIEWEAHIGKHLHMNYTRCRWERDQELLYGHNYFFFTGTRTLWKGHKGIPSFS